MRSVILTAFLISVVIAGVSQLVVPGLMEDAVERNIARLVSPQYVDVQIEAFPAAKLALGKVDKLTIDTKRLVVAELPVTAFLASAEDVDVNVRKLLDGELAIDKARKLRVTVILDESGLNQYFWSKVDPGKTFSIRLVGGFARLVGTISLLGRPIELTLNGKFQVVDRTSVEYIPTELVVSQTKIPDFLLDAVLRDRRFLIDLSSLPIPIEVEKITVEDGQVYVFGKERTR